MTAELRPICPDIGCDGAIDTMRRRWSTAVTCCPRRDSGIAIDTRWPAMCLLSADTDNPRDCPHDSCERYEAVPRPVFDVQHRDDRVHITEWVLGVVVDGQAKAHPLERLARRLGNEGALQERIAGRPVRIRHHAGHRTAEAFDAEGRPLPSLMA
jgi:hypothetical protein